MRDTYSVELEYQFGKGSSTTLSFCVDENKSRKLSVSLDGENWEIDDKDPGLMMINLAIDIAKMTIPETISVNVVSKFSSGKSLEFDMVYQREDIVEMRKTDEKNDSVNYPEDENESWDWDSCMLYNWFVREIVAPHLHKMRDTAEKLYKEVILRGLECPVLNTPLGNDTVLLKKCNHLLSGEAWSKINWKKSGDEMVKPCPLCRCQYVGGGEWTTSVEEIREMLNERGHKEKTIEPKLPMD